MKEIKHSLSNCAAAGLLAIFVAIIYSNTLYSAWHFDDYDNIVENNRVHLTSLNVDSIKHSFFGNSPGQNFNRPISYFSFALNWFFSRDNVITYHIVNVCIHFLTAYFLFLSILYLLKTPNINGLPQQHIYFIALLSATLWAINPIQIQAVTYIVQRMASMAALFSIIGIFCYLKMRLTKFGGLQAIYALLCLLAFLCGVGAKHNAVMLPANLLLIEFIFFQDVTQKRTRKKAVLILLGCAILLIIAGVFVFMGGDFGSIFKGYENRSYSIGERLLTQPRIVLFYLSQIFYPIADRFSITHDVTVSTSLFSPWNTLPSLAIILIIIGAAIWRIAKNPIFSFAVLFFFANHLIESTCLPLEMIFEHRNYLPSFFLFVPVSYGIRKALDDVSLRKPIYFSIIAALCALMIGIGISTYIRNGDWKSEQTLWTDAMTKAPESSRPLYMLARYYFTPNGQIDISIMLYRRALSLWNGQKYFNSFSYRNMADIYSENLQNYEKAVEYAIKSIEILPDDIGSNVFLCGTLGKLGRYDEAMVNLDKIISKYPQSPNLQYLKGFLLLKRSKPDDALTYFRRCLQVSPMNWQFLREIGVSFTLIDQYDKSYWFLKQAENLMPNNHGILLSMIDNRLKAGQYKQADGLIKRIIQIIGPDRIGTLLVESSNNLMGLPMDYEKITNFVLHSLQQQVDNFNDVTLKISGSSMPCK